MIYILVVVVVSIAIIIFPKIFNYLNLKTLKEGLQSPWTQITKPGEHLSCNSGPGTGYTPRGSVSNLQQCQEICKNDNSCKYITYAGGYTPKDCNVFTGNCNLSRPGKAYFYGNHEVWKINRSAIKANAAAAAAAAAEKIRAAEMAAAKAKKAEEDALAAEAAAKAASAADKAEAERLAAEAVKKAEEAKIVAEKEAAAAKKAEEDALAAKKAEEDAALAAKAEGGPVGDDLANQSTEFSRWHKKAHLEDNNLAAASSAAKADRLDIEELLRAETSEPGDDATRAGNSNRLKSVEGDVPILGTSIPTAKAAAAAAAIGNQNGRTPSPNLEIANITFIFAPSLEGRRSLPSQQTNRRSINPKERNYAEYVRGMKSIGNATMKSIKKLGPSIVSSMGIPSPVAQKGAVTKFPAPRVKDYDSVFSTFN